MNLWRISVLVSISPWNFAFAQFHSSEISYVHDIGFVPTVCKYETIFSSLFVRWDWNLVGMCGYIVLLVNDSGVVFASIICISICMQCIRLNVIMNRSKITTECTHQCIYICCTLCFLYDAFYAFIGWAQVFQSPVVVERITPLNYHSGFSYIQLHVNIAVLRSTNEWFNKNVCFCRSSPLLYSIYEMGNRNKWSRTNTDVCSVSKTFLK